MTINNPISIPRNKIYIVIPVFNRIEYTKKCLKSLKNQTHKDFVLIVVDDGSEDGTYEYIERNYPQAQIIKGDGHWWWTKSMAYGIESALKQARPGDFVLSLNNDCYFDNSYLEKIIKSSITNNRSIVGSLVVDSYNKNLVIEAGIKIDWNKSLIYGINDTVSNKLSYYKSKNMISDLDTLPGKGTLIPIEVFRKIGNFNYRRLPHYIGDYEYFCRAKRNGYRLIVSTESILYNFAKATGSVHLDGMYSSYSKVFKAMFGRKSKINIIDYLNFILLCCPQEYLSQNLQIIFKRFIYFIVNMFPFCYISLFIQQFRILFHNIPLYFKQNKIIKNIFQIRTDSNILCKICGNYSCIPYIKNVYDSRHGYPGKFDIYVCKNCGFKLTIPQLKLNRLSQIYTKYYPKRNENIHDVINNAKNIPDKKVVYAKGLSTTCHFNTKRGQNVLDIGCGTCQSLLEINNMGGNAWGIDVDQNSLKVANKLKLSFHLGTIYDCKFKKGSFDLITASQVLEHEPDPIQFLSRCKIFLNKTGRIIMSFPNSNSLSNHIWRSNWLHWHVPYHLNHFNKRSFFMLAKLANYKIIKISTVTPNLWTVLQIRSWTNGVREGERDSMWDNSPINKPKNHGIIKGTMQRVLPILDRLLIFNRFIDRLGFGDSFIVELKPC